MVQDSRTGCLEMLKMAMDRLVRAAWIVCFLRPILLTQSDDQLDMSGMLPPDQTADTMMEVNDNLFADFLRDIMMPPQSGPYDGQMHVDGVDTPSMAFRDLFSFGQDSNLELNNQDYTLMDFYQGKSIAEPPPPRLANPTSVSYQAQTPQSEATNQPSSESLALGTEAFKRSLWCWTPVRQDAGHQEQSNFNLQPEDAPNLGTQFVVSEQVAAKVFGPEARDKIVAMILSTCDRKSFSRVMSSFPSAELLNSLMQCFLASHIAQNDTWIHLPTLKIGKLRPELLASFLAAGAMFSSSLTIRKLGFAIQEAVRLQVPKVVSACIVYQLKPKESSLTCHTSAKKTIPSLEI